MALSRVVACWANDASEGDASDARVARAALLSQLSSRAEDLFRRRLVKVDVSEIPSAFARFRVRPIPRPLARPRPVTPATRRVDVCRHRPSSFRVLSAKNRVLRRARSVVFSAACPACLHLAMSASGTPRRAPAIELSIREHDPRIARTRVFPAAILRSRRAADTLVACGLRASWSGAGLRSRSSSEFAVRDRSTRPPRQTQESPTRSLASTCCRERSA